MAAAKSTASKPAAKATRKMLTPAERVAKLERELEAARSKAGERETKIATKLNEQKAKLVKEIEARQAKVDTIDSQLARLTIAVANADPELPLDEGNGS